MEAVLGRIPYHPFQLSPWVKQPADWISRTVAATKEEPAWGGIRRLGS